MEHPMFRSVEIVADTHGMEFELRPRHCPTCSVAERRVLGWRGGRYHRYGQGVPTRIVQCCSCALIFPDPFPYPRRVQEIYGDPDKYFAAHDEAAKVASYRSLVCQISKHLGHRPNALLDVGSGRGELLEAARLEGIEAVGLELSQTMIDYARTRFGATVLPVSIETLAQTPERVFDAVILNAVLEHTHDPDAMISASHALTRPGSVMYLDIPMEPSLLTMVGNTVSRLRRSPAVYNLSPTWPPYHVFGFNRRALRTLLSKHDFEMIHVRVHAGVEIPARSELRDRAWAFVGTQINRLANLTGTAANMYVWARRC